jgi:hypothetical protein
MKPMTNVYAQIPVNETLERNINLRDVRVVENAGGYVAPVTEPAYRDALDNALFTSNLGARAGDDADFMLDANLLAVDVDSFGFSLTTDTKASYKLSNKSNVVVYEETISIPYTAEFGEAFDGTERARLSAAKAIRENITHLIRVISALPESKLK